MSTQLIQVCRHWFVAIKFTEILCLRNLNPWSIFCFRQHKAAFIVVLVTRTQYWPVVHYYSLYAIAKRNVFSDFVNVFVLDCFGISAGSEFHTDGSTSEEALYLNFSFFRGKPVHVPEILWLGLFALKIYHARPDLDQFQPINQRNAQGHWPFVFFCAERN